MSDSNRQLSPWQGDMLPIASMGQILAEAEGLEPTSDG